MGNGKREKTPYPLCLFAAEIVQGTLSIDGAEVDCPVCRRMQA